MAGRVKLLQYQTLAYWRRAFSVRGKYDASAGFLLLILIAFAFRYVSILKGAAKSLEKGGAENLSLIFAIVFLAWILPVLESQNVSAKTGKFLHLPFTKTQFALINLATVFLLPTSIISTIISLAAIYPFAFSKNISGNVITLFVFILVSVFAGVAFVRLIKTRLFRYAAFLSSILLAFLFFNGKLNFILESEFLPAQTISQNIVSANSFGNVQGKAI